MSIGYGGWGYVVGRGLVEPDEAELRAELVESQLVGLAFARYVLRTEPLASASAETVADWVGPNLQRYLTEPAPSV